MSDTYNPLNEGFKSFFSPTDINDPRVNTQLRQRIALAMLQKAHRAPRNVGEGLTAIGEALGERRMMGGIAEQDIKDSEAGDALAKKALEEMDGATAAPAPARRIIMSDAGGGGSEGAVVGGGGGSDTMVGDTGADTLAPPPGTPPPPSAPQPPTDMSARQRISETLSPPPAETPAQPPPVQMAQAAPPPAITPAPTPPPITAAPGAPAGNFGRVRPPMERPALPAAEPMTPLERRVITEPGFQRNHYARERIAPLLEREKKRRERIDTMTQEGYSRDDAARIANDVQVQEDKNKSAKAVQDAAKQHEEIRQQKAQNDLRAQFKNLPPDQVHAMLTKSQELASSSARGLEASVDARKSLRDGAITGFGAQQRLDWARFVTGMGFADKGDDIKNTETFMGSMQPIISSILHQTSGTSGLSQGELAFARDMSAGRITLDAKTLPTLLDIIDKGSRKIVLDHHKKMETLYPGNDAARQTFGVELPTMHFNSEAEAEAANLPSGATVSIHGKIGKVR